MSDQGPDLPLAAVSVLEMAGTLPGPYCGHLLRRLGARVVKLEPPWGDPLRTLMPAMFEAFNRGKQSVAVDLKHVDAPALISRMARGFDVVIEGFRPGVASRLGVDHETLRRANPDLIYCSLSGFGQSGEMSLRPGHDATYAAIAGLLLPVVVEPGPPRMSPVPMGDLASGSLAALFVTTSLFARDRGQAGRYWDVSITDVLLTWAVSRGAEVLVDGEVPRFAQQEPATHELYRTRDDRFVALGAIEDHFWTALCVMLDRPDWAQEPVLRDNSGRTGAVWLRAALAAEFEREDAATWVAKGVEAGVPIELVRRLDQALADPLFRDRGVVRADLDGLDVGLPARTIPPLPSEDLGRVPGLGADARRVLSAAGVTEEEVAAWKDSGLLVASSP